MEDGIWLLRCWSSLLFETPFAIPGIFKDHRWDEGLVRDLPPSGTMAMAKAMASKYS